MFVSKSIEQHRADVQAELTKAQAHFNFINKLLDSIPKGSPDPVFVRDFGYCANGSLTFTGSELVRTLFEMYPPLDLVDVNGDSQTQKPAKYLRNEELHASIRPIFPAVYKRSGKELEARWWTQLGDLDIEVNVREVTGNEFASLAPHGAYLPDSHTYSTGSSSFFVRQYRAPVVKPTAMVAWIKAWLEFQEKQGFNAQQKHFLSGLRKQVHAKSKGPAIDDPMFSSLFTDGQRADILSFAGEQASKVQEAEAEFSRQMMRVYEWFLGFFEGRGRVRDDDWETKKRIECRLRMDTGLDVSIARLRSSNDTAVVDVKYEGWDGSWQELAFKLQLGAWPIRPQDIEVEYL